MLFYCFRRILQIETFQEHFTVPLKFPIKHVVIFSQSILLFIVEISHAYDEEYITTLDISNSEKKNRSYYDFSRI